MFVGTFCMMSPSDPMVSLEMLPNEILAHVLDSFSTKELLSLALINHRFHLVISRLLHRRLLDISSLPQNDVILECYRPSHKISTPYLMCRYLKSRTQGSAIGEGGEPPVLSDLGRLYSSFKPYMAEENRRRRQPLNGAVSDDDTAREDLFLDDGELFSQLCAVTNLVKTGPRAGLFLSHVNISDGVLRIWREWLAEVATPIREVDENLDSSKILWVDSAKNVGVRFRVMLGPMERMPVISGPNDQPPIAYKLEYEELLIRTRELLLAAEKCQVQEVSNSGTAVVIVSG